MDPKELQILYSDRLDSLRSQISDLLLRLSKDEILTQMLEDPVSNDYKLQRAKEIIEESLNFEQEALIDRLMQSNALLKTELKKKESNLSDEYASFSEEKNELQRKILLLESSLEKEQKLLEISETEANNLRDKLKKTSHDQSEILEIKEAQLQKERELLSQELDVLRQDLQKKMHESQESDSLKKLLNKFKEEYKSLEEENMRNINEMRRMQDEIKRLTERNKEADKQIDEMKGALTVRIKEKEEKEELLAQRSQEIEEKLTMKYQDFQEYKEKTQEKISYLKKLLKEKEEEVHGLRYQKEFLEKEIINVREELSKDQVFYEEKLKESLEKIETLEKKIKEVSAENQKNQDLKVLRLEKDWEMKLRTKEKETKEKIEEACEMKTSEFNHKLLDFQVNYIPINQLIEKEDEFRKITEDLRKKAEETYKSKSLELKNTEEKFKSYEKKITSLEKELESKNEEIGQFNNENNFLRNELKVKSDSKTNENKANDQKHKISSQAYEDLQKDSQRVMKEYRQKNQEYDDLFLNYNKLKDRMKCLNKELEEKGQEIQALVERKMTQETKIISLNHEKKSLEQENDSKNQLIIVLQKDLEQIKGDIRDKENLIRTLQTRNFEDLNQKTQKYLEENDFNIREIERFRVLSDKLEKNTKELKQDVKKLEAENKSLTEQLRIKEFEISDFSELKITNIKLKDQIIRKTRAFELLKSKLSEIKLWLQSSKIQALKSMVTGLNKTVRLALDGFRGMFKEIFLTAEKKISLIEKKLNKRQEIGQAAYQEGLWKYETKIMEISKDFQNNLRVLAEEKEHFQRENERIRENNMEINGEKNALLDKMKNISEDNEDLKTKASRYETEIMNVREFFNQAMNEFNSQQSYTKKQVERIRNETKVMFMKKIQEMEAKYRKDLLSLATNIRNLKEEHSNSLLGIGDEADKLQKKTVKYMNKELEDRTQEINELNEK